MKVLVGLSGGVDSAVAAYLLQQQGHEVVAGFMLNYMDETNPNCTTKVDLEMFHQVRQHLGLSQYEIFDYREEYEQRILNYIYESYQKGLTPNPDVYCNSLVKFDLFLEEAMQMGFDAVTTGHYAQIEKVEGGRLKVESYQLLRGVDHRKDQSYFLSQLNQYQLSKALFPLGGLHKSQVRQIAHDAGLPNANRPDSQGLCFIGKIKMSDFLYERIGPRPGTFVDLQGDVVGNHNGAYMFTIGQRRNLYLPFQAYVSDVDTINNVVTVARVGEEDALYTSQIRAHNLHWISGGSVRLGHYQCKIRYRQEPQGCELYQKDDEYMIQFNEPIKGVANGQIVVLYDGDEVMGSAVIERL